MKTIQIFLALAIIGVTSCEIHDPDDIGLLVPMTVDQGNPDHADHGVQINGTILHIETYGDPSNPVIIFIHGGPGDDFRSMLRLNALQDEFYCVFYDQRGAGLSQRLDPDQISDKAYIEDLNQIIEKYKRDPDDKVNIIGHSWGGQIATFYIDADPDRAKQQIDKCIYSDPGPFHSDWMQYVSVDLNFTAEWFNRFMINNEYISGDTHERADYWAFVTKGSNPDRHTNIDDPSPKWRWGSYATYELRDVQGANGWDWTSKLHLWTNEVLFIRSGLNEDHTPEYFDLSMEPYPNSSLVTIEDVGHDMCWSAAQEYMSIVRDFFNN